MTKIFILGSSGMLGNAVTRYFLEQTSFDVVGTVRSIHSLSKSPKNFIDRLIVGIDIENTDHLLQVFSSTKPDIVINCIGLVKQLEESDEALAAIPLNSLLPHRVARLAAAIGARLVHISTDCVFSGSKGNYTEDDTPDAYDLYGRSKLLGEVDYPNAITLRTSLIGHEIKGARSLINWFLSQKRVVKGFRKAIFSGLPTVEIARVIHEHVLPNPELQGLYHLSVNPISKYDLLTLVKEVYEKDIEIIPDDSLVIDRSLDSTRFKEATGFSPKIWPELVRSMRDFG